ncbi:unnamed protein product [Absidia cylindrospora]
MGVPELTHFVNGIRQSLCIHQIHQKRQNHLKCLLLDQIKSYHTFQTFRLEHKLSGISAKSISPNHWQAWRSNQADPIFNIHYAAFIQNQDLVIIWYTNVYGKGFGNDPSVPPKIPILEIIVRTLPPLFVII